MSEIVNSVGLGLDIVGVVLLFRFGLPPDVNRHGHGFLMIEGENEEEIKKAKIYTWISYVALACLIVGFALQILSNWV